MSRPEPCDAQASARRAGWGVKRPPRGGGSGAGRAGGPAGLCECSGTSVNGFSAIIQGMSRRVSEFAQKIRQVQLQ